MHLRRSLSVALLSDRGSFPRHADAIACIGLDNRRTVSVRWTMHHDRAIAFLITVDRAEAALLFRANKATTLLWSLPESVGRSHCLPCSPTTGIRLVQMHQFPLGDIHSDTAKRLYDAIENGVADLADPMLKDRIAELKATRDQARADAERAEGALDRIGPAITPQALKTFARQARKRIRTKSGGYRRDHLRALAQRVEVDAKEVRIMGSKSVLLRTLVAASSAKTAGFGVPSFVPKWRATRDSNSHPKFVGRARTRPRIPAPPNARNALRGRHPDHATETSRPLAAPSALGYMSFVRSRPYGRSRPSGPEA